MKKMNNKGFMLAETLIVATFLVTTLLFIYIQFNNITKTYDTSFKYNNVNGLYTAKNIIKYISTDGLENLKTSLDSDNGFIIDMTDCSSEYFNETEYCSALVNSSNIKTVLFTINNSEIINVNKIKGFIPLEQTMMDFIGYIDFEGTDGYRIIIEFNDNTYATLKI